MDELWSVAERVSMASRQGNAMAGLEAAPLLPERVAAEVWKRRHEVRVAAARDEVGDAGDESAWRRRCRAAVASCRWDFMGRDGALMVIM